MANGREWNTRERAFLTQHYPAGTPVAQIAETLGRSDAAVKRKAQEMQLTHPGRSSRQRIANFEAAQGKPLAEIARDYRDRRLSRHTLAHDIGIEMLALRNALPDALWQSFPRMTLARLDAARERQHPHTGQNMAG